MTNLLTFKVNYRVESLLKKIKMYLYNVNMYEKGKWKKNNFYSNVDPRLENSLL